MKPIEFSAMQHDTLTELFNIGIGNAAASLSEMINEEVTLSVPKIECLSTQDANFHFSQQDGHKLSAVKQYFKGDFSGNALLIFPEQDSLELVRRLLSSDIPLEQLSELEEDALLEVGNVILNACFYTISDALGCTLYGDIPRHSHGVSREILDNDSSSYTIVLMLSMEFSIPNHDVNGAISFVMNMKALNRFIELIDGYIERVMA